MRLFIAIELPPPVRRELHRVQSLLRPLGDDVRWTAPESTHLTLLFLGDVDDNELMPLDAALRPVASRHPRSRLRLGAAGTFPETGAPRVIWVAVEDPGGTLAPLQAEVRQAVAELGFHGDRRRFRPHVTIGRPRRGRRAAGLRRALEPARAEPTVWQANAFALIASQLSPQGARYERVCRYPLVGSA